VKRKIAGIPVWVLALGAAGLGVLVYLRRRAAAAAQASTGDQGSGAGPRQDLYSGQPQELVLQDTGDVLPPPTPLPVGGGVTPPPAPPPPRPGPRPVGVSPTSAGQTVTLTPGADGQAPIASSSGVAADQPNPESGQVAVIPVSGPAPAGTGGGRAVE
jgi:hypothetical protein